MPCGFHTNRWARAYAASVHEMLGADVPPPTFTASLGPDPDALREVADSPEAHTAAAELDDVVGDRRVILRIDRIDPSKNIVRGFAAYDRLLDAHPEWRGGVVFVAMLNASREGLPEYLAYRQEVEQAAEAVNDALGARATGRRWSSTHATTSRAASPGSLAYDVLLVNPIKDGLNLVAKEGPLGQPTRRRALPLPRGGRVRRARIRSGPRASVRRRARARTRCTTRLIMDADERRAPRASACATSPRRARRATGSPIRSRAAERGEA